MGDIGADYEHFLATLPVALPEKRHSCLARLAIGTFKLILSLVVLFIVFYIIASVLGF